MRCGLKNPSEGHCLASRGCAEGWIFLSASNNHNRFFFLPTFWSRTFNFNVGVAINESRSFTWMSAILKVEVICDVTMTSIPNVLTTELHDLLYNKCNDNTCCYSFFIYTTGRIKVCKIRFVTISKNRRKTLSGMQEKSFWNTRLVLACPFR